KTNANITYNNVVATTQRLRKPSRTSLVLIDRICLIHPLFLNNVHKSHLNSAHRYVHQALGHFASSFLTPTFSEPAHNPVDKKKGQFFAMNSFGPADCLQPF